MSPNLKSDQESTGDIDNIEKRIAYRLCCKTDRIKVITTKTVNEVQINSSALHEPQRLEAREVLRLTKVSTVDKIQTKAIQDGKADGNSIKERSITSLERQTTPSLYLPYLLADIPLVFNKAT